MPAVMDAPEVIEYVETYDLAIETSERPQIRRARPGFWRTLVQKIAGYCTRTPRKQPASLYHAHRPFETPADQLAQQYPTLYIRAYCGV